MAMCIYNNCDSVQKPFSSLAFFALPKDSRRQLWIQNSGNPQLATLSESAKRVVCEKHFSSSSLRKQFHRTILNRDAVPEKWSDSSVEQIEIQDYSLDGSQSQVISIDEESSEDYHDDDVNKDVDAWQSEYENSSAEQNDGGILEFEIGDNDKSSQSVNDHYPVIDNRACEVIVPEIDQNQQISGEEINPLESLLPHNQYPPFLQEVEIETVDSVKRKTADVVDAISNKIPKTCSDEPLGELCKGVPHESIASDIIVSSSTTKSDDSGSRSLQETNEEDKYFTLALMGILQRIPPQKKAFAKVNILKYLTELEYGVETSIN